MVGWGYHEQWDEKKHNLVLNTILEIAVEQITEHIIASNLHFKWQHAAWTRYSQLYSPSIEIAMHEQVIITHNLCLYKLWI